MTQAVRRIVVLGGGSAGWLTAALLAAEHGGTQADALQISLIESPDAPAIGVGEGTWPSMRETLQRIGLREVDLLRQCDAAFKQGSRFDGWVNEHENDRYYHPFSLPQGHGEIDLVGAWLHAGSEPGFAECVSPQPHVCNASLAPKQVTTPEFGGAINYGYHFDAVKLGVLLRQHATEKLGVRHVSDEVTQVLAHENGDIKALRTRSHGDIAGDLFIDCSGLKALLIGQHYGVALRSQQHVMFNDSALALQVPYADKPVPLASATIATAHAEGWTWDIGLPSRRGLGLVYSSAHTSREAAEQALRKHIERSGGPAAADLPSARHIPFSPGYRERFWQRNCVAIGLSSGFIEPLEASALALVELSAAMIRDEMPANRADMDLVAKRFNEAFDYRWARIIDFLKLHYALNQRNDSAYWREHAQAESMPERLAELLQLWRHRAPFKNDLFRVDEVFPAASYQYVLYGMGFKPNLPAPRTARLAQAQASFQQVTTATKRLLGGLPRHRDLIEHIHVHGMS
ncbi:tryptophan halogenase family protein [Roseateles oligotrophus]|uniref:Tryptophan 7-halogenase n=1 Tax=Roseateles oligotrophus TaxID=1769250 RepID=A0ABT2YK72_9BURK|nr:tryptophan halogenase family protein [Roseateles oligotrophus]MCV2370455.1 tryptophan 7-halogenase [Roseateles oligotrophus]